MVRDRVSANGLLAALPQADWARMRKDFEETHLARHTTLIELEQRYSKIHFPENCIVSTVAVMEQGGCVEMATIGCEGMVEVGAIVGSAAALSQYVVQVPGDALSIKYQAFKKWDREIPAFHCMLQKYAQAFVVHILQSVACNAAHTIEQRAARWLLTTQDRSHDDSFLLTQECFAEMLGVSRPVVSTVARAFQKAGLIKYARGKITIANREALEEKACECYRVIKQAYDFRAIDC